MVNDLRGIRVGVMTDNDQICTNILETNNSTISSVSAPESSIRDVGFTASGQTIPDKLFAYKYGVGPDITETDKGVTSSVLAPNSANGGINLPCTQQTRSAESESSNRDVELLANDQTISDTLLSHGLSFCL